MSQTLINQWTVFQLESWNLKLSVTKVGCKEKLTQIFLNFVDKDIHCSNRLRDFSPEHIHDIIEFLKSKPLED